MRRRPLTRFLLESLEGLAVAPVVIATWPVSRRWLRNWGSVPAEQTRHWPGDELLSPNLPSNTRAISVAASAGEVWPWLVQFGLGKAGFYSYEAFERLVGIPVTNIESIEPDLQSIAVGDEIKLHPRAPGIPVARLAPGRHICFGTEPGAGATDEDPVRSWSFYLEPTAAGDGCRLLVRGCFETRGQRPLLARLVFMLEESVDFVMEWRMLRTIKRLAERRAAADQPR